METTQQGNTITICIEFQEMNNMDQDINLIDAVKLANHVPGSAKFTQLRTDLPNRCYWIEFELDGTG